MLPNVRLFLYHLILEKARLSCRAFSIHNHWVRLNFKIQVSLKLQCLIEVGYKKRGRLETYFLSKQHAILCKTDLTTDRGKSKVFCIDFYRTH